MTFFLVQVSNASNRFGFSATTDEEMEMIILWTVAAAIGGLLVQNLGWFASPLLLMITAQHVSVSTFTQGRSIPHKVVNVIVGYAVGFWTIYVAAWIIHTNSPGSSWPIYLLFPWFLLAAFQNLRMRVTPYSWLAATSQIIGLVCGFIDAMFPTFFGLFR